MKKILLTLLCSIAAYAQPAISEVPDLTLCDASGTGYGIFNLTTNTNVVLAGLNPDLYNVTYHLTLVSAEFGLSEITTPQNFLNASIYAEMIFIRVTEIANPENYAVTSFDIIVHPAVVAPIINDLLVFDYNGDGYITVNLIFLESLIFPDAASAEGFTVTYYTSLANAEGAVQQIESPENFPTQSITIYIRVQNSETGCYYVSPVTIAVLPAFDGVPEPFGETTQTFTPGQTLANLDVLGQDIQWHTTLSSEAIVQETTPLEDGITYFASQTIDGVQSASRLGVTATLALGLNDNVLSRLTVYPNPASTVLTLQNASAITGIEVYNTLGQQVLHKEVNNTDVNLDVFAIPNGVYFVKVKAAAGQKTLRIIKQ
jgi:hypothetical protein